MSQNALQLDHFFELPSKDSGSEGEVPEWVHLLPAGTGGTIRTQDARGPFTVGDAKALIANSMKLGGGRLAIDENHSIDVAAKGGSPSPARGWIVEMEERENGIWGRVDWNSTGRQLLKDRAYRGISPVTASTKGKEVKLILRASLVNTPNMHELVMLHMETPMNWMEKLVEMLGLSAEATEEEVTAALQKALAKTEGEADLHSGLADVAKALKLDEGADLETVLNAIEAKPAESDLTALQGEVTKLTTQLNTVQADRARDKATTFVDDAIKAGRAGLKPRRDAYIDRHMKDPEGTEADIAAMPILTGRAMDTQTHAYTPDFDMDDPYAIAAHAAKYQKAQAELGVTIDFATAVTAVTEGGAK